MMRSKLWGYRRRKCVIISKVNMILFSVVSWHDAIFNTLPTCIKANLLKWFYVFIYEQSLAIVCGYILSIYSS